MTGAGMVSYVYSQFVDRILISAREKSKAPIRLQYPKIEAFDWVISFHVKNKKINRNEATLSRIYLKFCVARIVFDLQASIGEACSANGIED